MVTFFKSPYFPFALMPARGRSPQICTVCNSVTSKNLYPLSKRKNIKNPSFICAKDDENRYGQPPRPFYNILDVTLLQFWGGILKIHCGGRKNTKNVNNIVYSNIFLTIIMSDKVCTRFPSPCHTVTQTVHVTLLHGHGHGHR